MTPLTHHEILRYVGPFSRTGRHVDLARSDRAARQLVFKSQSHAADAKTPMPLTEVLQLDLSRNTARLQRTLTTSDGLQATLDARDSDLEQLLARVTAVPLDVHFRAVERLLIADSYRCPDERQQPLRLRESRVRVHAIEVTLDARTVVGEPMTVRLKPLNAQHRYDFPADLVAVLGMPYKLLSPGNGVAKFLLYAPAPEPKRSHVSKARFASVALHLQHVLGGVPTAFHTQFQRARWRVWMRRFTPLAIAIIAVACLPVIKYFFLDGNVNMNPLIFGVPNFLILAFIYLSRHEMPTIEFPPFPRPLKPNAWSLAASDTAVLQPQTAGIRRG